jgi:hypothetical protein
MGIQFNDNGTVRDLTLADMATPDFQDSYSDLFKGINGYRPRGHSVETMLNFFDTYEERFAEAEKEWQLEQDLRLDYLNHKHGQVFPDLQTAEHFNVQAALARYEREAQVEAEERAAKAEFVRRGSPQPAIEAWLHGSM